MADRTEMNGRDGQNEKKTLLSGMDPKTGRLIQILLVVLMVLITGMLIYGVLGARSGELIKENSEHSAKIQQYKGLVDQRDQLVSDTEELNRSTRAVLDRFSAGNTPETTILFLDRMANASGMSINTVEFGQEYPAISRSDSSDEDQSDKGVLEGVQTGDELEAEAAAAERGETYSGEEEESEPAGGTSDNANEDERELYVYPVTFSFNVSYPGLKAALDYIAGNGERMSVETFTSAYQEDTGDIAGSMTLNLYRLTGTGKTYVAPSLSGAPLGKTDLFA